MENTVKESVKTIPSKAKVRVIWEDDPNNYTQERQKRISKYIVEKYGNPNVQVIFKPKKIDTEAGEVEMTVADNVMDKTYQRKLFKEWVETNKVGVDWERLLRLDDKVNEKLSQERDIDYRYRNWFIKDIEWSNFLSYGDGNTLSFKELEGITVVTSNPPNMGGKTILSLDLLLFLFFNTTTKGTTAAKMFNKFRDCNEVKVKGTVVIDGVDYIIERIVTRKLKRDGINYTTRTDLSFYRVLPDGTVENLEGEQRRETEDFIKKSIGSVNDFLLTIITDGDNLETILHTKPTEKGRILSRFIGLEVIEDKETIVKEMKSKWAKGLKSDIYNITELETNIKSNEEQIQTNQESINKHNEEIETLKLDIEVATKKKEDLIESKIKIDTEVINLRPEDLDNEIKKITDTGKKKKAEYDTIKEHNDYMKQQNSKFLEIGKMGLEKDSIEKLIKNLEEGEYCTTCGQALKDVDHSVEIEENKVKLKTLTSNVETLKAEHEVLNETVSKYNIEKKGSSSYDRKSLMVDKLDLDLGRFRLDLREKKELKKRYDDNLDNIEANKEIDTKILGYASKITSLEADKTNKIRAVENLKGDISNCETQINKDKETIEVIKSEEEIKMIFEVYARMVGKNGIIKMIMKSVMPLINSEIDRLISDTVEFKLTVDINDKKEVEFLINKVGTDGMVSYPATEGSGFEKTVSSLALRMVMTKISCLPKPNIIVFDEVFNKVANENLELVGTLFEKAKEMFPNIFLISHNDVVKDWANNIITVNKENDVSSLNML
jgi:DNA repair exonuclease SbcCD ATPase subunit